MGKPDRWVYTGTTRCDHCERPESEWPAGFVTLDREAGVFTSDYNTCPDCVVDVHLTGNLKFGSSTLWMLREGIEFAYIRWFWYDGKRGQS